MKRIIVASSALSGVPRDIILMPPLFLLYVNNLAENLLSH